jgi:hypothetical protein
LPTPDDSPGTGKSQPRSAKQEPRSSPWKKWAARPKAHFEERRTRTLDLLRRTQTPAARRPQPKIRSISGASARKWRKNDPGSGFKCPKSDGNADLMSQKNCRFAGEKAADGIRTHDLLHGKQTL